MQYIDKVDVGGQGSADAFTGKIVHSALQRLYEHRRHEKLDSLEEMIMFLRSLWAEQWDDSIFIVKEDYTVDNYLSLAERCVTDYYRQYYPFDQGRTVALEERINIDLDGSGDYRLVGVVDRLTDIGNGEYEIHDYKTGGHLPKKSDLDGDNQLAIYSMGVKENYPKVQEVRLVWHYLAFDRELQCKKSDDQMDSLRSDLISLIDTIEDTKRFESRPSTLCRWCEYEDFCEQYAHQRKVDSMMENDFLNDPGVRLVDHLQELMEKQQVSSELDDEIEKVKAAITELSKREGGAVVYGTKMKASVSCNDEITVPAWNHEDRKLLNAILRKYGIWDEVSSLDPYALKRKIKDGSIPPDLMESIRDLVSIGQSFRVSLKRRD